VRNFKIAAALGMVEAKVNSREPIGRLSAARSTRVTPLMFEYEILNLSSLAIDCGIRHNTAKS